jgi:lipopolysaccharide transport system permease protein
MHYLSGIFASRELLANLTLREIRGKYKRTVFGQLWSLANPLTLMLIYTFVFALVFRIKPEAGDPSGLNVFALWLLCGLLPWTFFSTVLTSGANSLVNNAQLIQKVSFMRIVLPLSMMGAAGYNWLFEMAVLLVALSIVGAFVLPWIPLLLVIMVVLAVFASGFALMLSVANVFFRDTQYFIALILQMAIYLTPVIYPVSMVSDVSRDLGGFLGGPITLEGVYTLNPMVHFIEVFRNLLYDNRFPDPVEWAICVGWAIAVFAIGVLVFRGNERNLAERL